MVFESGTGILPVRRDFDELSRAVLTPDRAKLDKASRGQRLFSMRIGCHRSRDDVRALVS
jgi:hypothetical protein